MIRVGIAGMGGMGWFHASRYFQLPGVEIAAIADVRPERLEAKNAVTINIENKAGPPDLSAVQRFATASQMIEQAEVDIIDICLPTYLHAAHAIQALAAGRHVLCEKPMALATADADAMIAAAQQHRRTLMIAQCIRFWPEYQYLRQVMEQGRLGRLLSLNLYRVGGKPAGWSWENWFLDPARSGGSLMDLHIHDVDFVYSLLGKPQHLYASSRRAEPESPCEIVHALFHYPDGPQVSIQGGWSEVQIPFRAGYEAWFSKGHLRYNPEGSPQLVLYDAQSNQGQRPADFVEGDAYLNEIAYFVECIQNGTQPARCMPESARDALLLLGKERIAIETQELL